jgi:DNA-binding response OmpR family regulator
MPLDCSSVLTCEIAPAAKAGERDTGSGDPVQVLLVEDDPDAARLVTFHLSDKGERTFAVEWRSNLVDAMNRLARPGIDVVLLDLGMPELSGYKSYRAVELAAGRNIPVVIFTGDDGTASRDLTLGCGAADYLVKQETTPHQLRQSLIDAVARGR